MLTPSLPKGTSCYYSHYFAPKAHQPTLTLLHALCHSLLEIKRLAHSPSAGHKLGWWHTEIARLYNGTPTHPLTQALSPSLEQYGWPQVWFESLLAGIEADLQPTHYQTLSDLRLHQYQSTGVICMLYAKTLGNPSADTLRYAKALGESLHGIRALRAFGRDIRAQRLYFPAVDLAAFGLNSLTIFDQSPRPAIQAFLAFEAERVQKDYDLSCALLPATDTAAQRPLIILGALYQALLQKIIRQDYAVTDQWISLLPLSKLWIAWHTAHIRSPHA